MESSKAIYKQNTASIMWNDWLADDHIELAERSKSQFHDYVTSTGRAGMAGLWDWGDEVE